MREWGRKRKHYIPFFIVGRRSYFKFILKCVRRSTFQYTQMGRKYYISYYVYARRRRRRQQFLFTSHTPRTTLYYIFLLLLICLRHVSQNDLHHHFSRLHIFYHPPCIQFLSLFLKIKTFYDFKKGLLPYIYTYICFLYHGNFFLFHSRICFNIVMTLRKKRTLMFDKKKYIFNLWRILPKYF